MDAIPKVYHGPELTTSPKRPSETVPPRRVRGLADPTRLAILEVLRDGPMTVTSIARRLVVPPDRLYHHLDVLEGSELVTLRQLRPRRVYESTSAVGIGSGVLSEKDRAALVEAALDLV